MSLDKIKAAAAAFEAGKSSEVKPKAEASTAAQTELSVSVIESADTLTALAVFGKEEGVQPLIEQIRKEALSMVPDLETAKGRKEIASMAYKVAKSKTALDTVGKNFVAGKKAEIKLIDNERKLIRDSLDALRDEVRQPLNEWEAEQERIEAERQAAEEAARIQAEIDADHELALLQYALHLKEAAEAEELRKAEEKRLAEEAEAARIAHEAELVAKAKREAEEEAEAKRFEAEAKAAQERKEAAAAIAKAKAEKLAAEAQRELEAKKAKEREAEAKIRAEKEVKAAKAREKLAAEKAKAEKIAAAKKAEADKLAAVKAEKDRVEAERLAEQKAKEAREADIEHKSKIMGAAKDALVGLDIDPATARKIVLAIGNGLIPNVSITF